MIARPELLFQPTPPDPTAPATRALLEEVGQAGRGTEVAFFVLGLLALVPVVLFGSLLLRDLVRGGPLGTPWPLIPIFGGLAALLVGVALYLGAPLRPYRLPADAYARYRVVAGEITRVGAEVTVRPSHRRYRKVRWATAAPLAAEGWSPSLLVGGGPDAQAPLELAVGAPVWVGLDPAGHLPPLFLGLRRPRP